MARHLVKRQAAGADARGKLLASKGHKNRKQVQQVVEENEPEEQEELSDNEDEVDAEDNVENKGGRSPRRAALEAAKKIYYSARNYGPKNDDGGECSYRPRNSTPKSPAAPKKIQIIYDLQECQDSEPELDVEGDLLLECEEDMLSEAQTRVMKRQHAAHNDSIMKIREAQKANDRFFVAQAEFNKFCR